MQLSSHQNPICTAHEEYIRISTIPLSRCYPDFAAQVHLVTYLYSPFLDITTSLPPMTSVYSNFTPHIIHTLYPVSKPISNQCPIFAAHVKTISHLCMTRSDNTHLYSQCLVSTPSLQPTAHIQSILHLSSPLPCTVAQRNS